MASRILEATQDDVDGIIELLNARPPAFWMRAVARDALRWFVLFALRNPRASLLVSRPEPGGAPAGYVFAVRDAGRFWLDFALANPLLARRIFVSRALRIVERRRRLAGASPELRALPEFEWSPSAAASARIIGLFVHPDHRRQGIALELYLRLFDELKGQGVTLVEEYMGPDYLEYAGKFPETCGWLVQKCRCEGYKISKTL